MKQTLKKLGGGFYKPKYTGPYHNFRNHFGPQRGIYDDEDPPNSKDVAFGVALVAAGGLVTWGALKAYNYDKRGRTVSSESKKLRNAKKLSMGWYQHNYWKKGSPVYLPKPNDAEHGGDSPCEYSVERSYAFLDDDEVWEKFEEARPEGWVNVLPEEFGAPELKLVSMEVEDEDEEDDEDEDEEEELEEPSEASLFPYNFYNPSQPLPSERPEYRRVLTVLSSGAYKETVEDDDSPYKNVFAGKTVVVDPDGANPVKVKFSDDWRDCSPELLTLLRERMVWKYKDDWKTYAPPKLGEQLQAVWEKNVDKIKQAQLN